MEVATIGFAGHSADSFFGRLRDAQIEQLLDVRVNNSSQLAGFTKSADLKFFLRELCNAEYQHLPSLAPTRELLKHYRDKELSWTDYERRFIDLLTQRNVERELPRQLFQKRTVLLCSEHTADKCHRRLVIEYLNECWGDVTALHL